MKKLLFIFVVLLLPLMASANDPKKRTIHVVTAGTLPNLISENEKYEIEELTLSGRIDGTDILLLRDMCRAGNYDYHRHDRSEGKLKKLDLSEVTIEGGGLPYILDCNNAHGWEEIRTKANRLPQYVFRYSELSEIVIPNSVTSIGDYAFTGCYRLTSITIPSSVKSVGECAFDGCTGLTSLTIGDGVETIGYGAFGGCTGLTTVTIGNNVKSIGEGAFCGCTGLTTVTIGDGVETMGLEAFSGCTGLTSLTIGNVKSIGEGSFQYCSTLTSVTIPNSVKSVGKRAFYKCTGLTTVTIGDGVETMGLEAFSGCTGLTSFTIGNNVKSIGSAAFSGCTGLKTVTIGNNVMTIGSRTFEDCSCLKSITLGKKVSKIYENAFMRCLKLVSVTSLNATPPTSSQLSTFPFKTRKVATLYVPLGCIDKYRHALGWKEFKNIIEIEVPSDSPESDTPYSLEGDINGDGIVDSADIEDFKNYIMGNPSANFNMEHADYNGDGVVNVADIVSIIDNNKWIMVTDNFSKSIPFTKIRVLNKKAVKDAYRCIAFSTSPNKNVGVDCFFINFGTQTIGDNKPISESYGIPISSCTPVGGNWYEYEFSCPVYFAYYQDNCPRGQVKVCIDATYTQLDYIERDPSHMARIKNIGVTLSDNMKFQLKVYPTNGGGGRIIGNNSSGDKDDYRVFWAGSNNACDAKIYFDYGDDGVSGVGRRLLKASTISNLYELEVGNYYVKDLTNNNYILSGSTVTNANIDRTIRVFGNNDFGRIYYLKVFDGNTLIKYLIPVRRDCDGFVTLYDTISKTYLNTIDGTFKASDE